MVEESVLHFVSCYWINCGTVHWTREDWTKTTVSKERRTQRVFCMLKLSLSRLFSSWTTLKRWGGSDLWELCPSLPGHHQNIPGVCFILSQRIQVEPKYELNGTQLANSSSLAFSITPPDFYSHPPLCYLRSLCKQMTAVALVSEDIQTKAAGS